MGNEVPTIAGRLKNARTECGPRRPCQLLQQSDRRPISWKQRVMWGRYRGLATDLT